MAVPEPDGTAADGSGDGEGELGAAEAEVLADVVVGDEAPVVPSPAPSPAQPLSSISPATNSTPALPGLMRHIGVNMTHPFCGLLVGRADDSSVPPCAGHGEDVRRRLRVDVDKADAARRRPTVTMSWRPGTTYPLWMAGTVQTRTPDEAPSGGRSGWAGSPFRVLGVVLVLVMLALAAWTGLRSDDPELTGADVDAVVEQGIERALQAERDTPPAAATAYQTILPSLVTVTTRRAAGADGVPGPAGLGAGVVVNADGVVLTALHVVDSVAATIVDDVTGRSVGPIEVTFADGTTAGARVAGREPENDMAVLAVDRLPEVVVPAVLGGGVRVGDEVFAVGNPLGLRSSLSAGVVSATGRTVGTEDGGRLSELIQFDAAVNPGNSGGPLLNRDGQVVGIITGLANPTDQAYFVGIGFAVPIATAGGAAGGPQR